jgi:hypothetical protein
MPNNQNFGNKRNSLKKIVAYEFNITTIEDALNKLKKEQFYVITKNFIFYKKRNALSSSGFIDRPGLQAI